MLIIVDLPDPLEPSNMLILPVNEMLTSSTAVVEPKRFVIPLSSISKNFSRPSLFLGAGFVFLSDCQVFAELPKRPILQSPRVKLRSLQFRIETNLMEIDYWSGSFELQTRGMFMDVSRSVPAALRKNSPRVVETFANSQSTAGHVQIVWLIGYWGRLNS